VNPLDYVLIGLLAVFVIWGYVKGFFRQILQIVAIAAAFFLAARYHAAAAEWGVLSGVRERSPQSASVIAFLCILFASGAAGSIIASWLGKKLQNVHLRSGDGLLGAFLGLGKGVLILGGISLGLKQWKFPEGAGVPSELQKGAEGLITTSVLVPRLADGCLALVDLIPRETREEVTRNYNEQRRRMQLNPPSGAADGAAGQKLQPGDEIAGTRSGVRELFSGGGVDLGSLSRQLREDAARPVPSVTKEPEKTSAPVPGVFKPEAE
jgi:membrane protein required for colicin V production